MRLVNNLKLVIQIFLYGFIALMSAIPWLSIVICIIAIYTIVFVTMIYSTKKVRKENIIDVIRNDNV